MLLKYQNGNIILAFFPLSVGRFNFTRIDVRFSLLFPRKAHTHTHLFMFGHRELSQQKQYIFAVLELFIIEIKTKQNIIGFT